ncbi:MAG: HDIG domain-containing protein, partial [Candidatus Omnitrophica bacterium]|nr:HDIG domain-containing protein [Candidatus Omnitrophota bacterium]
EAMRGIKQPSEFHPEGDVFAHTHAVIKRLKNPSVVLAFSALFHDLGKPATYAVRNGRITFYGHASLGADLASRIMKRLRFSNDEIQAVGTCIENHMKFGDVQKMRLGKLKQLIARPTFEEELELHRVDCLASHRMLNNYRFLRRKQKEFADEQLRPKAYVNGHDLIRLGMVPGPVMKPLLEDLYERQLEGAFRNRQAAILYAKRKIAKTFGQGRGHPKGKRSSLGRC